MVRAAALFIYVTEWGGSDGEYGHSELVEHIAGDRPNFPYIETYQLRNRLPISTSWTRAYSLSGRTLSYHNRVSYATSQR